MEAAAELEGKQLALGECCGTKKNYRFCFEVWKS